MFGRATGIFRQELLKNGHRAVKLLTRKREYNVGRAYVAFQKELASRANELGLDTALNSTYPNECNCLKGWETAR